MMIEWLEEEVNQVQYDLNVSWDFPKKNRRTQSTAMRGMIFPDWVKNINVNRLQHFPQETAIG